MKEDYKEITIKTSEIKKGDLFDYNGKYWATAETDAYRHKGIWSVDFERNYRYGWQSRDTDVVVRRIKNILNKQK